MGCPQSKRGGNPNFTPWRRTENVEEKAAKMRLARVMRKWRKIRKINIFLGEFSWDINKELGLIFYKKKNHYLLPESNKTFRKREQGGA